jgi:hypothetical protein
MKKIGVEIKGISPYLMNAFGMEDAGKTEKQDIGSKDYSNEATTKLYKLPNGEIYVPSTQVHSSLMEAGKQLKVVGKGKSTYSKLFGSFIVVSPDVLVMLNQTWEVDKRAVVVPATKGRVIRYRPKFTDWGLKFTLDILDDGIPISAVKQGLDTAGAYCGIGDFRPQKKGPFGRFIVTSFKEVT